MFSKNVLKMAGVVLFATAGAAAAQSSTTNVTCDGYIISINNEQVMKIKETTGEDPAFTDAVCMVSADLNHTTYNTPTKVRITLSNGNEYEVLVQADSKAKR